MALRPSFDEVSGPEPQNPSFALEILHPQTEISAGVNSSNFL
jgi:hypothetical protein